ncbi:hypothetical protein L6V77_13970 [Myxococcota bacterium]|nr:hypothetical protein [Myxococcota bacterium]
MRRTGHNRKPAGRAIRARQRGVTTLEYIVLGAVLVLGLVVGVSAFKGQVADSAATEGEALMQVARGDIAGVRDRYGDGAGGPQGAGARGAAPGAEPEQRVLAAPAGRGGGGGSGADVVSSALSGARDFADRTSAFWKNYAADVRALSAEIRQGLADAEAWKKDIERVERRVRNGERLSIRDRIVKSRMDKAKAELTAKARELAMRPVVAGIQLWQSTPPAVKMVIGLR